MPIPTLARLLLVTADDFGIGPETSRGILDLAKRGAVTSTVMLVNSPHAADAVRAWRVAGQPLELGWHPCLTLDEPILSAAKVPSLVSPDGRFHTLGELIKRIVRGRISEVEVAAEFRAQCARFIELVGELPANVNAHHHVHIFPPINRALRATLMEMAPVTFVRRVIEPRRTLLAVPGARIKRMILSGIGRKTAWLQDADGFLGCDRLIGITDPPYVRDSNFFSRWLAQARGRTIELACHPGHLDSTLIGRDGTLEDGQIHRRIREFELLNDTSFLESVRRVGFTLVSAAAMQGLRVVRRGMSWVA